MSSSARHSCVSLDSSSSARAIARKVRQQATKKRQETQRAVEHVAREWLKDSPRTPSKRRRTRKSLPKISALPSPPASPSPSPSTRRPVKGICYMCGEIAPLAIVHDQDAVLSASKQKGKQVETTASTSGRSRSRSIESQLDRLQITEVEEEAEVDAILDVSQTTASECSQTPARLPTESPPPYSEAAAVQWLGEPMDVDQSDADMPFVDPQPTQYEETFVGFDDQSPSKSARNRRARRLDSEDQPMQRSKLGRGISESPTKRRGRFDPFARVPSSGLGIKQRLNSSDPFIAAFARYEHGWKVLGDDGDCVFQFDELPWPVCTPPKSARDVTVEEVETFYRLAKPPPDFKFLSVSPLKFREFVQGELDNRWSWEMAFKKVHSRTGTCALYKEASDAAIVVRSALKNLLDEDEF